MISANPDSLLHPSRSAGFLLRNPFRMEFAFTLKDLGIRIVLSRITEKKNMKRICKIIRSHNFHVTPEKMEMQLCHL